MPEESNPVIGFSGKLDRASDSVKGFFKNSQGQPAEAISISKEGDEIVYSLGSQDVKKSRQVQLDAVVSDSPDNQGILVTFRHPLKREAIVGVAIAPDVLRPEVDGVWVADEGSGGDGSGGGGQG